MPYARSQYVPIDKMLRKAEKQSKHQRCWHGGGTVVKIEEHGAGICCIIRPSLLFPDRTKELLLAIVWVVEQLVVEEFHKVTSLFSLCI